MNRLIVIPPNGDEAVEYPGYCTDHEAALKSAISASEAVDYGVWTVVHTTTKNVRRFNVQRTSAYRIVEVDS